MPSDILTRRGSIVGKLDRKIARVVIELLNFVGYAKHVIKRNFPHFVVRTLPNL